MGEGMIFRLVVPGEAAGLVAAYDQAVAEAQRVRALLSAAGLDVGSVLVVPSWTEAGEPVVYLSGLTAAAQRSLAHIVRGSVGPPPPRSGRGRPGWEPPGSPMPDGIGAVALRVLRGAVGSGRR